MQLLQMKMENSSNGIDMTYWLKEEKNVYLCRNT